MKPNATSPEMSEEPTEVIFHIDDKIYQIVGFDLEAVQSMTLEGVDPDYFASTAKTLLRWLGREQGRQHAAIQLRLSYLHGLETAMALTFAALQAPGAVPAWLRLYRVSDLDRLTTKVSRGSEIKCGWVQTIASWRGVAELLLQSMPPISMTSAGVEVARDQVIDGYADALSNMAREFLSKPTREEYNDLKHGFRISRGGFSFAISSSGTNDDGSTSSADLLAHSEFGSTSATVETIAGQAHLLRYAEQSRNWDPVLIANRLQVVAGWIACVKAALMARVCAGKTQVRWSYFADREAYVTPWLESQPMREMTWRVGQFSWEHPPTRSDLKHRYEQQKEVASRRFARTKSNAPMK
jgi:hypothetical protein